MVKRSSTLYVFELYTTYASVSCCKFDYWQLKNWFCFFSITLVVSLVMDFKEMDRSVYDKNDKDDF